MRGIEVALLLGSLLVLGSCKQWLVLETSSLDFNDGKIHRMTLKNAAPDAVAKRIAQAAEKRDVMLVYSSCHGGVCECSFRRKPQPVSRTLGRGFTIEGTGAVVIDTLNFGISSLLFTRIRQRGDDAVVEMLGVPVINENVISCPPALQKEHRCRRLALKVPDGKMPERVFRSDFGVDISGKVEAQIISGIFAELQRS